MAKNSEQTAAEARRAAEIISGMWISRDEFDSLLRECELPEKIAQIYLEKLLAKGKHTPGVTDEFLDGVRQKFQPVADLLKQHLPDRLYWTAGLLAYQLTVSRRKPLRKAHTRSLVDIFFFQTSTLPVRDGRGGAQNIKHAWTDKDRALLSENAERLAGVWAEAKRIAMSAMRSRDLSRRRNWRVEVLRAYPDLPPDLLERLASPRAADAKPSELAVAHAGRLSVPVTYSTRRLRQEIRAWKFKTKH